MKAHLLAWVSSLAIISSLVIIEGTWIVEAFTEWPRRATLPSTRGAIPTVSTFAHGVYLQTSPWPRKGGAKPFPTNSETLRELTFRAAEKCRVPARLLFSLVRRESGFDVAALSSSGAVGLTQVKPYHAYWPLDVWDPETNLNLGACLLRRHYDRMHSWELALHAYHGGQYRLTTSKKTREYAREVLGGHNG